MSNICVAYSQNPDEILHWAKRLSRFSALNSEIRGLSPLDRGVLIERVKLVIDRWRANLNDNSEEEISEEEIFEELRSIHPFTLTTYTADVSTKVFLKTLSKDLESIKIYPLRISSLGMNGPTLLINYIRRNQSLPTDQWIQNSVIKWTSESEFFSSIAYKKILQIISSATECSVPQSLFLNLDRHELILMDESRCEIPESTLSALQEALHSIRVKNDCLPSNCSQIMVSEKISGPNLRDFILDQYANLPLKKRKNYFMSWEGFLWWT